MLLCGDGFCNTTINENCITCPLDCEDISCGMYPPKKRQKTNKQNKIKQNILENESRVQE